MAPLVDVGVAGGYFIWLTMPDGVDASEICARAESEYELMVGPGPLFKVQGDDQGKDGLFERQIRLSIAWADEEVLPDGVARLAQAVETMLGKKA